MTSDTRLTRAREELDAARSLVDNGFGRQSVSRAYYAAFYAAEVALMTVGETRSRHGGVVAAFGQHIVVGQGLDETAGRLLRSLHAQRSQADYSDVLVSPAEAATAVRDAEVVVDAVAAWLDKRVG